MRGRISETLGKEPLLKKVFELADGHGEIVYLVGGTLRDLALGLTPRDLDFAAQSPYEMAQAVAEMARSKVISLGKEATPTYRIPLKDRHMDFAGIEQGDIQRDLLRRDFTVDAMAYDSRQDVLLDPTGGIRDLDARVLKAVCPEALSEDPVRIVKAFRLLAQLPGFTIAPQTLREMRKRKDGLVDVPAERVCLELGLLLGCKSPSAAVREMASSGVLFLIFPELKPLDGLKQNRFHHADALEHTLETLAALDGPPEWMSEMGLDIRETDFLALRLAAIFHDTGKALTRTVDDEGRAHFYGHPKFSAELAEKALRRWRFSNDATQAVAELCLNHLRPLALLKTSPRNIATRRLVHDFGPRLSALLALSYADKSASKGDGHEENLAHLRAFILEALEVQKREGKRLQKLPKLVNGLEALEILKMQRPGPELGIALDALMEKQVAGEVANRRQAVSFLKAWAKRRAEDKGGG